MVPIVCEHRFFLCTFSHTYGLPLLKRHVAHEVDSSSPPDTELTVTPSHSTCLIRPSFRSVQGSLHVTRLPRNTLHRPH